MLRSSFVLALGVLLAALAVGPGAARAEEKERPRDEFDRLARRLERQAHDLREEMVVLFKKTPHGDRLEERVREIERQAHRIQEITDREGRSMRVREVLDRLDEEFRGLDRIVDDLGREKELDRRAFDRFRDDLREMRETVHRMRREL